jgi:glycosyltransferase involved in cell wall biosynthesis
MTPRKTAQPLSLAIVNENASWGGLEINLYKKALWMHQRGHHVLAIGRPGTPFFDNCKQAGIPTAAWRNRLKYLDLPAALRLVRVLRRAQIRLVWFSLTRNTSAVTLAGSLTQELKLIFLQQMQLGVDKKDALHTWQFRKMAAWVAPLPWLARQVKERTHIAPGKVVCIAQGIDTEQFVVGDKETARRELGLPPGVPIAGIVGRWDDGKGHLLLVEAIALLARKGIVLHGLLMGGAQEEKSRLYRKQVEARIAELGLKEQFHILEPRTDPSVAYRAMDIFAMCSVGETYGMVTLEALLSGCCVVGARSGGTIDLLDEGALGPLFENRNSADLARVLAELLPRLPEAQAMLLAQRPELLNRYDAQLELDRLEELSRNCLQS